MTIADAIITYLEIYELMFGTGDYTTPQSEQGKRLAAIYGREIQPSSLTGQLAVLKEKGILAQPENNYWSLTKDYKKYVELLKKRTKAELDATLRSVMRAIGIIARESAEDLAAINAIGDVLLPKGTKAQKREAGFRQRAEETYGGRAMFTGETEWSARQASHTIEVKTLPNVADNSIPNALLLRSDIHAMRDTPGPDGVFPVEVHVHPDGAMLRVNTKDPAYRHLDRAVQRIDAVPIRELHKRILLGNMVRKIPQDLPIWFIDSINEMVPKTMQILKKTPEPSEPFDDMVFK
jgi:hypothetical protein